MENLMYLDFISGINNDGVKVTIIDNDQKIFEKRYNFGYSASSSRTNEECARKNYEDSIKYNWVKSSYYQLKPFIFDILNEIKEKFNIKESQIVYGGYNVFNGETYSSEKAKEIINSMS